ncbi:MAG: hypothetical protein ACTSRW_11200 [Candidatus Helarchaeota archaeon]
MKEFKSYKEHWLKRIGILEISETKKQMFRALFKEHLQDTYLNRVNLSELLKKAKNVEDLFWPLIVQAEIDVLKHQSSSRIVRYFLSFRSRGGFYFKKREHPDVKMTFFALLGLYILNEQLEEDFKEQTVDFLKTFLEGKEDLLDQDTFYALGSLVLLDSFHEVDEKIFFKRFELQSSVENRVPAHLILKLFNAEQTYRKIHHFSMELLHGEEHFFWGILILMGSNILSEHEMIEVFNSYFFSILNESSTVLKKSFSFTLLKKLSMRILLGIFIFSELEEQLEISIYQEFSRHNVLTTEHLLEQYGLPEKVLMGLIDYLSQRHDWFNVKKVRSQDLARVYFKNIKKTDQRLAGQIFDQIRARKSDVLDIRVICKKVKCKKEDVVRIILNFLDMNLVSGSIKETSSGKKPRHELIIQKIPEWYLILKRKIRFEKLIEDKSTVLHVNRVIQEKMHDFSTFPTDFKESIMIMINNNELELAESKLKKNYGNYNLLLDHCVLDLEKRIKSLTYFDERDLIGWEKLRELIRTVKKALSEIARDLTGDIKKQKELNISYDELIEFVDYVNATISRMQKELDSFVILFFKTCKRHELTDQKRDEFLEKLREMEDSFKNIADDIMLKNKKFEKLTKKFENFRDLLIFDRVVDRKNLITAPQLTEKKPFEAWFKDQWDFKRHQFIKIISDLQASLYKRDQLREHVNKKRIEINSHFEAIHKLEKSEDIYQKVLRITETISDTEEFINDFIFDTSKILEIFPDVALDVPHEWSQYKKSVQKDLKKIKATIEKSILNEKLKLKKNELETIINKWLKEFRSRIEQFSELERIDWLYSSTNFQKSFESKLESLRKEIRQKNEQINKNIREMERKFPSFVSSSVVAFQNWRRFYKVLENTNRQKRTQLLEKIISNLIERMTDLEEKGGRLSLEEIGKVLGINSRQVKQILEVLEDKQRLKILYLKTDRFVVLNDDMKKQLELEELISTVENEVLRNHDHFMKLFKGILQNGQISNNDDFLTLRIDKQIEFINGMFRKIEGEYREISRTPHNSKLVSAFSERITPIEDELERIRGLLIERREYSTKIRQNLLRFSKQIEKIKPIDKIVSEQQAEKYLASFKKLQLDIEEMNAKLLIQGDLLEKKYSEFKNCVSDLLREFGNQIKSLRENVLVFEKQAKTRLRISFEKALFKDLSKKIADFRVEFRKFLQKCEKMVSKRMTDEMRDRAWNDLEAEIRTFLENSQREILEFIEHAEKDRELSLFKHEAKDLLIEWNHEEILESFEIYKSAMFKVLAR